MTKVFIDVLCHAIPVEELASLRAWCTLGIGREITLERLFRGGSQALHPSFDTRGKLKLMCLRVLHTELLTIVCHDMRDDILTLSLSSCSLLSLDCVDTFEDLFNMLVDSCRILSLTNHLEQILIGEEVEAREVHTLGSKQIVQLFLDDF